MPRPRNLVYLIADGAHARFVVRSESGDFVAIRQIDGSERLEDARVQLRGEHAGRSFESVGGARHGVGRSEGVYQRVKGAFAREAAGMLNKLAEARACDGVVLVAPKRLLPLLRRDVGPAVSVVAEIAKDLTKTPDHELGRWLTPLPPA